MSSKFCDNFHDIQRSSEVAGRFLRFKLESWLNHNLTIATSNRPAGHLASWGSLLEIMVSVFQYVWILIYFLTDRFKIETLNFFHDFSWNILCIHSSLLQRQTASLIQREIWVPLGGYPSICSPNISPYCPMQRLYNPYIGGICWYISRVLSNTTQLFPLTNSVYM